MSDTTYLEPLDKFLELGRPETYDPSDWIDYVSEYNLTDEHTSDLVRMLEEYSQPNDANNPFTEPEGWSAIHAWRALGQMKAESATQTLLNVFLSDVWNDWGWEDLPQAMALYGDTFIDPLKVELAKRASNYDEHCTTVQSALSVIGKKNEHLRERISQILMDQLEKAKDNDATLNGFLIASLLDFKVEKAIPLFEKAFATNNVDTMIVGDWEEVQVDLGLLSPDEVDFEAKRAQRRAQMQGLNVPFFSATSATSKSNATKKKKKKQRKKVQMQNRKKKKK